MFFLGTHMPSWFKKTDVPLFVSRRRLFQRKRLPRAKGMWALDSGGFTELNMFGRWTLSAKEYAEEVRRYDSEIGNMAWAAQQDWMCEPFVTKKTGYTTAEHQIFSVNNYLDLREIAPELPIIPVLQGWSVEDYLRHAEMFDSAGVDLARLPTVGVGSVCRRQAMGEAGGILMSLRRAGLRNLHGFGFKVEGLRQWGGLLQSSDSTAWSFAARRRRFERSCPKGNKTCANCLHWDLEWREQVVTGSRQMTIFEAKNE